MQRLHHYSELAEVVRRQRKQQSISQEDMAAALQVAHTTLARLEKGVGTNTLHLLFQALDELGIALYVEEPAVAAGVSMVALKEKHA